MNYDYSALTADPSKPDVKQYRLSCEVRGYDDDHGLEEQKAAPAKRGLFGKGCVILLVVICGIVGVFFVLFGVVFLATGTEQVYVAIVQLVIGAVFLGISFLLIGYVRGMTTYASWVGRYRLSSFARANGMTYVFRADPSLFPGITPAKPRYPRIVEVKLRNVLRARDWLPVAIGFQDVTYNNARSRDRSSYSDGNWNFVAINFGSSSPSLHLIHHRQQDGPDPLQSHFRVADGTGAEQVAAFFTPEQVAAIAQTAPGYDVVVHSGWLYLLKDSLFDGSDKAEDIEQRFQIAEQLGSLVAGLGRR